MRKLFIACIALAMTLSSMAQEITREEALGIAQKFFSSSTTRSGSSQFSVAQSSTGYYAINRGAGDGFVIVAANDCFGSQVLGYADTGAIDALNMPDNLRWVLRQYDKQAQSRITATATTSTREAVKPLLTCYWDQSEPFNNLCPTDDGKACYTGCVATAVSQIMYYHKWPKQGTGSISYKWNSKTLSKDFSQSTYDWDAMLDYYTSESSEQANNAVALLMADVGYGSKMEFGTDGSAAYSTDAASALVNYFGYGKTTRYANREYYTHDEWDNMLYGELAASRPFYYSGSDKEQSNAHAFVIDGYDSGYYHVNWGWSGTSNGYFLISDLTPSVQGAGGSGAGYGYGAEAIVGIQPATEGSTETIELYNYSSLSLGRTSIVKKSSTTQFNCYVFSNSLYDHKFTPGLKVVDSKGNTTYVKGNSSKTLTLYDYTDTNAFNSFNVDMTEFPSEAGSYDVYLTFYVSDTGEWVEPRPNVINQVCNRLTAKVSESTVTFSSPSSSSETTLTASDIELSSKVVADTPFYGSVVCTAAGGDYYDDIQVGFATSSTASKFKVYESYATLVDVGDGESQKVKFTAQAPSAAGTYYMSILNSDNESISDPIEVEVISKPQGKLALEAVSISMPSTTDVDPSDINISFKVKCTSGLFNDYFFAVFWEPEAKSTTTYITSDTYLLTEGDEQTITFSTAVPSLLYGKTYEVGIYANGSYITPYDNSIIDFTTAAKSAIESIAADGDSQPISIYSVNGARVSQQTGSKPDLSSLPKGVYIVKSGKKSYKVIK